MLGFENLRFFEKRRQEKEKREQFKNHKKDFYDELLKEENKYKLILLMGLENIITIYNLSEKDISTLREVAIEKINYELLKIGEAKL